MLKKLTIKGLVLGTAAGLLVTLFDGFFMLTPKAAYIPYSFPLLLLSFNILFWMMFGWLSGFSCWIFFRRKEGLREKEYFYRVVFFLAPFAMIYGLGGRLPTPHWPAAHPPPVFDHHLSFIWVSVFLLFLLFYYRKRKGVKFLSCCSFLLDLTVIILLFQFCSNISCIGIISRLFPENLKIVYTGGVLLIAGFYFLFFYAVKLFEKDDSAGRNYFACWVLFFAVVVLLPCFFLRGGKNPGNYFPHSDLTRAEETAKRPDVILIVLDTVRADRMSVYGNQGTTVNLEKFSRDALVFENCIASSSWTLPSHASMFTGLSPSEHGSHTVLGSKKVKWFGGHPAPRPLSDKFVTLTEVFRYNGYKTAAIISNFGFLAPWVNIKQGFQIYDSRNNIGIVNIAYPFRPLLYLFSYVSNVSPKIISSFRTADDITGETLKLLDKRAFSPLFLFLNYMDAHAPNYPPRPFSGYFPDTPFPQLYRFKQYMLKFTGKLSKKSWDSYMLTQYDAEIAFLDDQLGRLFSHLKDIGIYNSSLIIVTSDHGELFGEHGLYGHRNAMYEGNVRIPLIIKFPFNEKVGREKAMITLADLFPTVLSICELPVPEGVSGKAFGNSSAPVVSELYDADTGLQQILYDEKYKYMVYEHSRGDELYDLGNDPMEQENLAEKLQDVSLMMKKKLKEWNKIHRPKYNLLYKIQKPLSRDTIKGLEALGYMQNDE